jgi:hypothetical protein
MTSTNFIGFFRDREKLHKAQNSLQIAGFKPTNIIVQDSEEHPLMVSVQLSDKYDYQMAKNIFNFHGVNHIDEISGKIDNADELRKIISIHSKQQIFSPKGNGYHNHYHEGMNAEVLSFRNE